MVDHAQASAHWDGIYSRPVEELPWYSPQADPELLVTLGALLPPPARLLDIGCGPGTTAADMGARGYDVLGVDISPKAIAAATAHHGLAPRVRFCTADILLDDIPGAPFDGAIDRGAFGTLPPQARVAYVTRVAALLPRGAPLLLKVFSVDEPGEWGPHRFSPQQVRALFAGPFTVERIDDTVMPSTLDHDPRTLFVTLRRA